MAVTRAEVLEAYRWILGRDPESEEAIQWGLLHQDVRALRLSIMNSEEFRNSIAGPAVAAILNRVTALSDPILSKSAISKLIRRWSMLRGRLSTRKQLPRGFLYVAAGKTYREEVIRSIESLRAHGNHEPIAVFTDGHLDDRPGVIISPIQSGGSGRLDKLTGISQTPFERTVYLDTDTLVVDKVGELFDLTDRFDIAAAHEHGYRGHQEEQVPESFFELNGGVIVYRWSRAMGLFMARWLERHQEGNRFMPTAGRFLMDQPPFRYCLWKSELKLYVLPAEYNYRSIFPGFARDRVKIFHGRHGDFEAVTRAVNSGTGARVFEAYR